MREFRAALAMYLYVALMAYTAVLGVNWALALDPQPRPLIAILRAVDPGHSYLDAQGFGAHFALLGALDVLSFLAMAATPFLAYAAVARRAAAPHPALMRALASALAPVRAWALACDAAADRMAAGATARDSLLAMALMAAVTHSVIHVADMVALVLGHPGPPLAPLRGALHGAVGAPMAHAGLHHALAGAADAMALLALLGSSMLLDSIASRVLAPACARLWRRL